jgi:hypothetical protein
LISAAGRIGAATLRHLFQKHWTSVRGEIGKSDRGNFICNPVSPAKGPEPSEAIGVLVVPSHVDLDIFEAGDLLKIGKWKMTEIAQKEF